MPPVRLDPFQNIVGVGWPLGLTVAALSSAVGQSGIPGPMTLALPTTGPGPPAKPGDLLIAQVGTSHVSGSPPEASIVVTISPPAGWTPLYFDTVVLSAFDPAPFQLGAGAWFRYLQEGDPTSWVWTFSDGFGTSRTGAILRITGARTAGFPAAFDIVVDSGGGLTPRLVPPQDVIVPSIDPGVADALLLAFVNLPGEVQSFKLPGSGNQVRENRIVAVSQTQSSSHTQAAFSEAFPGPGATGPRTLTSAPIDNRAIAAHIAIAPKATP